MPEAKLRRYYTPAMGELFHRLKIGVVLLAKSPPGLIFANEHFNRLARGKGKQIIDTILSEVLSYSGLEIRDHLRRDMEIEEGFTIGYTVYNLSESEFIVFLSDITYKQIFLENRDDNRFYDRLSRIIAELAHEIGNPLASVGTTLQVLQGGMDTWDRRKKDEYIQRAITEMDRLSGYLKKIRDFSTVSPSISLRKVPLEPLLNRIVDQNRFRLEEKCISVISNVDPSVMVLSDEVALQQVLLTLLLNSIEILPGNGKGKIRMEVEEVTDRFVKLVYRNNGPPISQETRERIFMPFHTSRLDGNGIGLAVALKLMTRMGGKISLESPEKGWGAKFVLHVPVTGE